MRGFFRRASRCRDTVERGSKLCWENNRAVFGPCSAAIPGGIAQRDGRSSPHGDLLQFAIAEKTYPLAVGRKEGDVGSAGTAQERGGPVVHFAHVELAGV